MKTLFFPPGFCLAGVFAFSSFSRFFLTSISFPNLIKGFDESPHGLWGMALTRAGTFFGNAQLWMVLFGSFSLHIHTQHSESTFSPYEEHFNCNDPNSFLFCTVISVWGFQLSRRCVSQVSAHCHLSGTKKPPQRLNTNVRRTRFCHWVEIPSGRRRAGWWAEMTHWVIGTHRHSSWGPSCCGVLLVGDGGDGGTRATSCSCEQRPVAGCSSR